MPFISKAEYEHLQEIAEDNASLARQHTKKVKELNRFHKEELSKLEVKVEDLDHKLTLVTAERDALKKVREESVSIKSRTLTLDERERLADRKDALLSTREEKLDQEESAHYKSGYQDGVADGLRKGYELTADDRQNMASIAALAAASHSDGATQKIAEEIVLGMQRNAKQLTAGKSK